MQKNLHLITATAIIAKDGKYLVLKRAPHEKVFPNKWTVPGGKLKPEDYIYSPRTTKEAWYFVVDKILRREIKEECNLEVGKLKYLLDLIFIRPDDVPVITLSYYADYKSGEVELEADFTEYFWGTVEELKDYDLISGIYDEIKMVDEKLRTKN